MIGQFSSRITAAPGLEQSLASVLEEINQQDKWQTVADFPEKSTELQYLIRMEAIQTAVNLSGEGDIVLVAGKGHEPYQEIAGERIDFDDRRAAYKAINLKKTKDQNYIQFLLELHCLLTR